MKLLLLPLALVLSVLANPKDQACKAQDPEVAYADSHLAAAAELLEASGARETMEASMDAMLEAQMAQVPQMAQFETTMREFFGKYMSWDKLAGDMARLQAGAYTEVELRELTAFYRTPLGQKVKAVTPQLTAQGAAVGQRAVAEHMPELQAAIVARAQELQESGGMSDPSGN